MAFHWKKKAGLHHVCLRVQDVETTVRFYKEALNAQPVYEWGPEGTDDHGILLDLGEGDIIEIFHTGTAFPMGLWQHIAVYTDDINASFNKALACGARPNTQPGYAEFPNSNGDLIKIYYAFVDAPGGETIEFIQSCLDD